ncbi:MAG: histidine phosphatase family protein [Candidatus Paceibacterota bacterium]
MPPLSVIASAAAPLLVPVAVLLVLYFMRTRRFYFIRHGETVLNAEHIRQGTEGSLSPRGREQAKQTGHYLQRFPVGRIIASSYPRAVETAKILDEYLRVPIVYSDLLIERRNPSEIIGKHTDDPEVVRIVDQMDLAYHDDDYRYSDEENFADLKRRARKCLNLLARQGVRETVVVTHHVFLKMLVAYLLYRERLHAKDFVKLSFFNYSNNASITVCEFHPWKIFSPTRGWEVVSYNEQPE